MRILHIFRAPLGGLYRHVLDVARGQIERGHEVGIFCDSGTGGSRATETLAALEPHLALGLTRIPMRRLPHPIDFTALASLTGLRRRTRPHVLHGHGSKGGLFARIATDPSLDRHTIRAYTPHGGSFNYNPGSRSHRLFMMAERVLARRTDLFLFESEFVKSRFDEYVGATDKIVRVVRNGISEAEFAPLQQIQDPFDLLYLGELRPAKGIETLIDALALIRRQTGRRLTLLVVGSGPSEPDLQERAKAAGVWSSIAFVPPQPIRDALSRANVMVVPSRAESLPYVILEAAAAAIPLVSTNVGGIPEIFGARADELIPPGDPVILASRILGKVDEPEPQRRASAEALSRQVKAGFCIDGMIDGVLRGYREALGARGMVETGRLASAGSH